MSKDDLPQFYLYNGRNFLSMPLQVIEEPDGSGNIRLGDDSDPLAIYAFTNRFMAERLKNRFGHKSYYVMQFEEEELQKFFTNMYEEEVRWIVQMEGHAKDKLKLTIFALKELVKGQIVPIQFGQSRLQPPQT